MYQEKDVYFKKYICEHNSIFLMNMFNIILQINVQKSKYYTKDMKSILKCITLYLLIYLLYST